MVQSHAHGIGGILLIGTDGGKRRLYFERAAADRGVPVAFLDWKDVLSLREESPFFSEGAGGLCPERQGELCPAQAGSPPPQRREALCLGQAGGLCPALHRKLPPQEELRRWAVKIDGPEWESSRLRDLEELTDRYRGCLERLSRLPAGVFLNHPLDIAEALDKRRCKERLVQNGVPVTHMYQERFSCGEELFAFMKERRVGQVFVKPRRGSGAAGAAALRFSPRNGRLVLYTCAVLEKGEFFNTKRMCRLEGKEGAVFLDGLLKLDCIVERWHGKETFQGYCYDLRVIVQGGRIEYILPRLSKGPITNLHLNNRSVDFADLGLDERAVEGISQVCLRAAHCYPRLKSIGMDVLLEQGSRNPRIIEVNAQGDLLHRDVYGENRIYGRQVEMLGELIENLPEGGISAGPGTGL